MIRPLSEDEVREFCRVAGLEPDAGQLPALSAVCGASGTETGLTGPGASGVLALAVLAWLFIHGEQVLWVTRRHEAASDAFRSVADLLAGSDGLHAGVRAVRKAHGSQGIELLSGARVMFRTWGNARGYSASRLIVSDADVITPPYLGDCLRVVAGQRDGGGQVILTAHEFGGDALKSLRERAAHSVLSAA